MRPGTRGVRDADGLKSASAILADARGVHRRCTLASRYRRPAVQRSFEQRCAGIEERTVGRIAEILPLSRVTPVILPLQRRELIQRRGAVQLHLAARATHRGKQRVALDGTRYAARVGVDDHA
jgi:hypothetical protein